MILSLFRRIRSLMLLGLATDQSASNPAKALTSLEKLFKLFGSHGPSKNTPVLANLLYASLCVRSGRENEAYSICKVVIGQVNLILEKDVTRSQADSANYLLFLCKWLLSTMAKDANSEYLGLASNIAVKPKDLRPASVSPLIRRTFPIRLDDAEKTQQFIEMNSLQNDTEAHPAVKRCDNGITT